MPVKTSTDAEAIARKLGYPRAADLILHLPLRYQDETRLTPLRDARLGDTVQIEGVIEHAEIEFKPRRQLVVQVVEGAARLYARFLHFYPSQVAQLQPGMRIRLFGEVRPGFFGAEMVHPQFRVVKEHAPLPGHLTPIYPAVAGLSQYAIRRAVAAQLAQADLADPLPQDGLPGFADALQALHNPPPEADLAALEARDTPAWQRLKFDELLAQQLSLRLAARQRRSLAASALSDDGDLSARLLARLPFPLTGAQRRAIAEIRRDLARPHPMNRLLQGDVGSGKTLVAAMTVLPAIAHGHQAAVMAPTEILAEQLYLKLHEWLTPLGITVAWLAAAIKGKVKKATLTGIAEGAVQVAVGTHALFQEDVVFKDLVLAIVDEQHRFGVAQRLALREKGAHPPSPPGGGAGGEGAAYVIPTATNSAPGATDKHYIPLPEATLTFARQLRKAQTDAEHLLWQLLRNREFADAKFQRQKPIGPYFLDFYCHEHKLAIELDGGQHSENHAQDEVRDRFLNERGIQVVRHWNNQVIQETEAVLQDLWNRLHNVAGLSGEANAAPSPPAPDGTTKHSTKPPNDGGKVAAYPPAGEGSHSQPHLLMMSATPIPRSLAMSYYADLDVSVIDELPPGRTPITTRTINANRREEVVNRLRDYCLGGAQAYWVCPLVEESEKLQLRAAEDSYAELCVLLPELKVGLVHGRMKADEKAAVMSAFKAGDLHLLVATTVIEVGVDVPNAALMVIEHAERYGLAQLHQLRGRVGRGARESSCVLLYETPLSETAKKRLKIIRDSNDGFAIARADLHLRGPGEFLGARQSGDQLLRFADLELDAELLERARDQADGLIATQPEAVQRHLERWLPRGLEMFRA